MDDSIKVILESIRAQIQDRNTLPDALSTKKIKLTVKYVSRLKSDHKFRIVTSPDDKIKDVINRLHDAICGIENTSNLTLRLYISNNDESVQILPDDRVHETIDVTENEQEKLMIKIDELRQSKTYCDKGIQTNKITIKLPEVVQNSLPDQVPKERDIISIDMNEDSPDYAFKVEPIDSELNLDCLSEGSSLLDNDFKQTQSIISLLKNKIPDGNVVMEAYKDGSWYPARIIEPPIGRKNITIDPDKHVFVHFCGLSSSKDQWLQMDRVRFLPSDTELRNTLDEFYKAIPSMIDRTNGPPTKILKILPKVTHDVNLRIDGLDSSINLMDPNLSLMDDRRYKCGFCGKGFKRREHLINHERVHTGEKPFKCELCDAAFGDPSNWRKHKKKHITSFENLSLPTLTQTLTDNSLSDKLNSMSDDIDDNAFLKTVNLKISSNSFYEEHDKSTPPSILG